METPISHNSKGCHKVDQTTPVRRRRPGDPRGPSARARRKQDPRPPTRRGFAARAAGCLGNAVRLREAMNQVPEIFTKKQLLDVPAASGQDQLGLRLGMWYWKDETKTLEFRRNKSLDNFLVALLHYLSHYLEKISLEKKPKSYMVGLVEKKKLDLVLSKLEAAQKYLAQKYCVLVLGLGMPDKHHMCCGKEKISNTQKDWKFFESFYTFCAYVAWIVFRRQYFTEIEEEIGRLFRTNMFNIPRRKREDEESGGEKNRMTLVQFRRMMAKRPAIKKAINMRSPAMSTLLPSLREKAQSIFEKKYHQVDIPAKMHEDMGSQDAVPMPTVGILGEPRYLFNPHTLLPIEPEENMKLSVRKISLIERNNMRIQSTLDLVMKTLSIPSNSIR
ncbi:PREDICTED: protein phosphatase 1 regulatory subunit 36 isoform X3 [Hipposideros armiger]|uniref:Protein phosphatase 1 regulatory subunit 36 isoform X3 n=1 Tax=Hipposideros armiger TaxID=186990 RepID=A0A8B7RB16_HIPAR|nr:PREDICTED: protein phosphatase 1 regulatory subunit 36 isoform X3 [Hipposideros armiger]